MEPAGPTSNDRLLDAALELAHERGWSRIHLHDVAQRLNIPLTEVAAAIPDLDALGNLLFVRARDAMLACGAQPDVRALPASQRIERVLLAWLDTLAPHRAAARDILLYKVKPPHLHHQAALVVACSRTVQWLREAAGLTATGRRREREETSLTVLFVTTLLQWLTDPSPGQERTKRALARRLHGLARRLR